MQPVDNLRNIVTLQQVARINYHFTLRFQMAWQNTVAVHYFHVPFFLERFLVAFAKLRRAAITFVMSVRPSVRPPVRPLVCPSVRLSVRPAARLSVSMEQLGSHWMDWHEVSYLSSFRKFVDNVPVSLKSDKNNMYFTWRPDFIYDNISRNSF